MVKTLNCDTFTELVKRSTKWKVKLSSFHRSRRKTHLRTVRYVWRHTIPIDTLELKLDPDNANKGTKKSQEDFGMFFYLKIKNLRLIWVSWTAFNAMIDGRLFSFDHGSSIESLYWVISDDDFHDQLYKEDYYTPDWFKNLKYLKLVGHIEIIWQILENSTRSFSVESIKLHVWTRSDRVSWILSSLPNVLEHLYPKSNRHIFKSIGCEHTVQRWGNKYWRPTTRKPRSHLDARCRCWRFAPDGYPSPSLILVFLKKLMV